MLRPGVMHRNESKFKTLIRRELKKREKQGVAEGAPIVVAQAPIHIRNPKKQQSRQDKPLTAYQQGVAAQGEPYKNPHPFDPKAGADVNYDHNQYRAGYKKQGVAEGSSTTWEVSFDYGPHMSETVKVQARSAQEAVDKVETAAEKKGRSIMVNWARPAEQGIAEGLSKRDQKDVAAIRAAIARLEAQLNHPNADRDAIQQSIAHEKKRLALYGQGVSEGTKVDRMAKHITKSERRLGHSTKDAESIAWATINKRKQNK
jgi:hypothetical protein